MLPAPVPTEDRHFFLDCVLTQLTPMLAQSALNKQLRATPVIKCNMNTLLPKRNILTEFLDYPKNPSVEKNTL